MEDQEMSQQSIGGAGSLMSIGGINNNLDLGDEPEDEFDSDYDPLWD